MDCIDIRTTVTWSRDDLPVTDRIAPLTIGLPVAPDLPEACIRRLVAALAPGVRGHC